VLGTEFDALRARLARGESGVIDAYAATDPAEFFAVVSEHFFEQPAALAGAHPALYGEFVRLYRCDPLAW
jgi:Mlc titration factor MtfA (ptsG expression regulator)